MTIKETYRNLNKHDKVYVIIVFVLAVAIIAESIALGCLIFSPKPEPVIEEPEVVQVYDVPAIEEPEDTEPASVTEDTVVETPEVEPAQTYIPETEPVVETSSAPVQTYIPEQPAPSYSSNSFKSDGVWYDDSYRYTWYSSNDAYHYQTPEWSAGSDGIYRDSEGYVVVASSDYAQGTVIDDTPFGPAKVYDTGCASGTLDVYTNF